jgi:hypothetical protein
MSRRDKKLKAMEANPQNDWQISDLKSIAQQHGIEYRQPGTSHVTFSCRNGLALTIPAHKPIKPVYIKKFIQLIESLNEENIQ